MATEKKTRAIKDPEIAALDGCRKLLQVLEPETARRVLKYLGDRFANAITAVPSIDEAIRRRELGPDAFGATPVMKHPSPLSALSRLGMENFKAGGVMPTTSGAVMSGEES